MAVLPTRAARRLLIAGVLLLPAACATGVGRHPHGATALATATARAARPQPIPDWMSGDAPDELEMTLEVLASAYNSVPGQTDSSPTVAAWGDRLHPGVRSIAVSHDLIALGLGRGAVVRIDGLPGEWRVLDRMHSRWSRHIDLYFGTDVRAARLWGRRPVTIRFVAER
jgi:3D (Asp-Asp-Asp) domain-containing protein